MTADEFNLAAQRSERKRRRVAWLAALAAPALIALVAVLLVQQLADANRLHAAEAVSQDRRVMIQAVLSAHQDVETGQRGFLLTGRDSFLEPFHTGGAVLDGLLPQLRRSYAQEPAQLRELAGIEEVSRQKRAFASETVALRRAGDLEAMHARVIEGRGKLLMDDLRVRLGRMMRNEAAHLQAISDRSDRATAALRYVTFGMLAVLALLLIAAAVAISRMLEQRHKAMIALEDVSRRRAAILNSAMDGIIILNPSGTVEAANAAAVGMFGYREEDLLGRDAGLLFADTPAIGRVAEVLRDMQLQEDSPGSLREIVGRRRDGTTFPTDVAVTIAPLAEGLRYVAVIRDITERKRVDQMKTEFVSTVSHELRTPLSSIAGSLGLLAGGAGGELGEKARRLIAIAHNNADRLVRLINDILDIEKLESGKMRFQNQRIELAPALEKAIEENRGFGQSYQVAIALEPGDRPAWAHADPDRLAQVVTNLLSNAIKFSPPGGTVKVTLAPGKARHRITVKDNGPGIPEEFRSRIFGKFAQADGSDSRAKGGTGLGLSIVREIVSRLGGTVSFDSREGEGTQFHVQLPALEAAEETPVEMRRQVLLYGREGALPGNAGLPEARYEVRSAGDFETAARLLDGSEFDVILADMGLAGGSAVDVIRHARRSIYNEATPIVAFGDDVEKGELDADLPLVVDWLRKPDELASLGERIDAAMVSASGDLPSVLHVDDDPDILRVVSAALRDRAKVTSAQSLAEARAAIAADTFDLVILDLTLRDGRGPELLGSLRGRHGLIPIVVFSAEDADPDNLDQFAAFLTKARTPMQRLVEIVEREARKRPRSAR